MLQIGVPREIATGERRVALIPESLKGVVAAGGEVAIERGAGVEAGFLDEAYENAGARIADSAAEVLGGSDLVLKVQPPRMRESGKHEIDDMREGAALISFLQPLNETERVERLAKRRLSAFSMELMPRITRAQSMDALSSQSTIAGYRAVLLAAAALPRIFPMLVTAAGTLKPAKLLVIGAGVAGLQALGTAKRLGAVTSAYDTRDAVKEQVQSLGAKFVELDLESGDAEDAGGYARAQSEEFYEKQRVELGKHVAASDVVITTALVPNQPAPRLITAAAVAQMKPGSVVVDLAAEAGGNCELTEPDAEIVKHGVTLIGYTNLPSQVSNHASQMYAKNLVTFLQHLMKAGSLRIDLEDEITRGTLVTHQGEIVNQTVRALLGTDGGVGQRA